MFEKEKRKKKKEKKEKKTTHFAVDEQPFLFTIDHVLLHFGDVMRHIIDKMHIKIIGGRIELLGESL